MTVTYQRETWASYRRDCAGLWAEHYEELAVRKERMAMKPDERAYRELEASGALVIITARELGVMVGYVLAVVRPHLHYADVLCGFEDAYFMSKSHRKGMAGVRLLREWERAMKDRGCKLIFAMTKPWLDMSPIFKRLGFTPSDLVLSKWIGEGEV